MAPQTIPFDVIPDPIMTCERCESRNVHAEDAYPHECPETGYCDDATVFKCYNCGLVAYEPHYEQGNPAELAADNAYHEYAEMELF